MSQDRRKFLQNLGALTLSVPVSSWTGKGSGHPAQVILPYSRKETAFSGIRVAVIGFGIMGSRNARTVLTIPGIRLVAVCDLYQGRLERARELYGKDLLITRDYRDLLWRKDIDAVIICTSDHWHDLISMEALQAGKAVYCEKPVVHRLEQGQALIRTREQTNGILQVGSQRVSSIAYAAARKHYLAGDIGQLNCIEAAFDRHTALGAWQYTMPPHIDEKEIDWKAFHREGSPAFDPVRFFRWRNYREYGTGVAGDLFVHLLSGIHFLTDAKGPVRIYATGGLSYWKDGRDVPDLMTAILDYPETTTHPAFQVLLKVNLASGGEQVEGSKVRIYGTEGMIDFGWNDFVLYRNSFTAYPNIGGWDALDTYPAAMQEEILHQYRKKYPAAGNPPAGLPPIQFRAPEGYDDRYDHFVHFFESIEHQKPVVEDAVFGFRAAAPCLACNESYFQRRVIHWDPDLMREL